MSDTSRTVYQGILVPDSRVKNANIIAADSSYTQASPRPGVPSDDSAIRSDMVLEASGSQSAGGDLPIMAIQGGYPGRQERGGGFAWLDTGAEKTAYVGWDTPGASSYFEWNPYSSAASSQTSQPSLIKLADETVVQAARHDTGSIDTIKLRKLSGGSWSSLATITVGSDLASNTPYPCMVLLPTGRLLLFAWVVSTSISQANVRMWYSDNDGATWAIGSRFCLRSSISTTSLTGKRLRAAYSRGQILMLAGVRDGSDDATLYHLASSDLGTSFRQVATTADLIFPDVVALASGGFLVQYAELHTGAQHYIRAKRLGSAYSLLASASAVTIQTSSASQPHCLWQGDDGTVYSVQVDDVNTGTMSISRSTDGGGTWLAHVDKPYIAGESTFDNLAAVEAHGRSLLAFDVLRDDNAHQYAIGLLYLGGYTTITMPMSAATQVDIYQHGWDGTWTPIETPGDAGYAHSQSGSPVLSTTAGGYYSVLTTSAEVQTFGAGTLSSSLAVGIVARFRLVSVDGNTGYVSTPKIGVTIQVGDGSSDYYQASICISENGFRVVDSIASSAVGAIAVDTTSGIEFLVALFDNDVATWYRTATTSPKEWTAGPTSTSLTSGGGAGSHFVR